MARKTDRVADGCGIDGAKGQNFTKKFASSPWTPPLQSDGDEGQAVADKKAKYSGNQDSGLRRVGMDSGTGSYASRDIFDDVEANQPDSGGGGGRGIKPRGGRA